MLNKLYIYFNYNFNTNITFNQMNRQIEQVVVVLNAQMQTTHGVTGFRSCQVNGSVRHSIEIWLKGTQWRSGTHCRIHSGLRSGWYQQRRKATTSSHALSRTAASHSRSTGQRCQAALRRTGRPQITRIRRVGGTAAASIQRNGSHGTG